jgi:hypothetical protein
MRPRYKGWYGSRNMENGIDDFKRRLKNLHYFRDFLASRNMLCFEYNDGVFDRDFCEVLSEQFSTMVCEPKVKKIIEKFMNK